LKAHFRKPLLIIALATFSLLIVFRFIQDHKAKPVHTKEVLGSTSTGLPAHLKIPSINVDANIEYVDVTQKGTMDTPVNIMDVGWFKLGPRPGEIGSAVIAGHFDGKNCKPAVFFNLYKLKKGDRLYIEDDKGMAITFVVQGSHAYDPGYAEEVFSSNDSAHLNLITCDGVWNGVQKSYTKRLVVFADITD